MDTALAKLETMAARGAHPEDVALGAKVIAAGWWNTRGDLSPDRLVILVQELRHWCRSGSSRYALHWADMNRLGKPVEADEARRWAEALEHASRALRLYD